MKIRLIASLAIIIGVVGCTSSSTSITSEADATGQVSGVATQATSNEIGLELLSVKDITTQLAARKGKVVVLDMWATW